MPTAFARFFAVRRSFACFVMRREIHPFMDNSEVAQLDWIVHNFVVGSYGSHHNKRPKINRVIWRECLCIILRM